MTGQKINHNIEELCLMAHETQKIGLLHVIPDLTNSMDNFYDFCFERDSFPSFKDKCNYMNKIFKKFDLCDPEVASYEFFELFMDTFNAVADGVKYGYLR